MVDAADFQSSELLNFIRLANSVCETFEQVGSISEIEFLSRLDRLLPAVYSAGCLLPDPWAYDIDLDDSSSQPTEPPIRDRHTRWMELTREIGLKLGWHRVLQFVYDPVGGESEAIHGDLADILADIYLDLREGLDLYQTSEVRALRELELTSPGWGRAVAEAMLPIHSLVHFHYNDDDEVFDI